MHAHIFFPRIFPSDSSSCVTACLKMKTWVLSNDSYQEVRLRSYFPRTCLWYRFCNKLLPSSHHPIFYRSVSHSTSNHIQRLMLQSVPYRFCKLVESYFPLKNFMTRERRATLKNDVKFPGEGISGRWMQLNERLTNLNLFRRNCSALQQILV